jgi:hypothetical protein
MVRAISGVNRFNLKGGESMGKWTRRCAVVLCLLSLALSGCGYFSAKEEIKTVERMVSELKAAGGDKLTPYEYCSAESFLQVSKYRFSENNFKHAGILAGRAKSAAEAGLAQVKKK